MLNKCWWCSHGKLVECLVGANADVNTADADGVLS